MKCSEEWYVGAVGAMDGEGPGRCYQEAMFRGKCEKHGGALPSIEELMTLLGKVTGWGESVTLSVRRSEAIRHVSHDETERTGEVFFSVGTNICGDDSLNVSAHDKNFLMAVWRLCEAVPARLEERERWTVQKRDAAKEHLKLFLEAPPKPVKTGPYR